MTDPKQCYQATPHGSLIKQIIDPRVPKNEREWAAAREIERLTAELATMTTSRDDYQVAADELAWENKLLRDGQGEPVGQVLKAHLHHGAGPWCKEILLYSPDNKGDSPENRVMLYTGAPPAQGEPVKSLAECRVGPCDCDPHIEYCDQCAPFLFAAPPARPDEFRCPICFDDPVWRHHLAREITTKAVKSIIRGTT